MLKSRWLQYVALGGCLAAFVFVACPTLSQENVSELRPTVNESEGMAAQSPLPKENSTQNTDRHQFPSAQLAPNPVSHEEPETKQTCDTRCQEAEDREKADLVAQRSMADSTREMVRITKWQLYIGGAGVFLLVITIAFTIRATNAAVEANRIARETARRELRAYVSVTSKGVRFDGDNLVIYFVLDNAGQTPAKNIRFSAVACVLPQRLPGDFVIPNPIFKDDSYYLYPGVKHTLNFRPHQPIIKDHIPLIKENGEAVYFFGILEYTDIFDVRQTTRVCWFYRTAAIENVAMGESSEEPISIDFKYPDRHNDAT